MLEQFKIVGFVLTKDAARARKFYEGTLRLRFLSEDDFGMSFDSNGNIIRLGKAKDLKPAPHTVLGWEVTGISEVVRALTVDGITFEKYGFPGQDAEGVWTAPDGSKVAWFKDPDGNTLSLSEHAPTISV